MRLDGLPSYEKKYRGKMYQHVDTYDSSDSLLINKKEAQKAMTKLTEKGAKCIMERQGNGFSVYVCSS